MHFLLNDMICLKRGDCLELMKEIPDKSIDMILCDLPYGQTARNKWDSVIPFDLLWKQYNRIIKRQWSDCIVRKRDVYCRLDTE